jgi:hypothetical protein
MKFKFARDQLQAQLKVLQESQRVLLQHNSQHDHVASCTSNARSHADWWRGQLSQLEGLPADWREQLSQLEGLPADWREKLSQLEEILATLPNNWLSNIRRVSHDMICLNNYHDSCTYSSA